MNVFCVFKNVVWLEILWLIKFCVILSCLCWILRFVLMCLILVCVIVIDCVFEIIWVVICDRDICKFMILVFSKFSCLG